MNLTHQSSYKIYSMISDSVALNVINLATLFYIEKYSPNLLPYIIFCIFSNISWTICSYTSAIYMNSTWLTSKQLVVRTCFAFGLYNCFSYVFAVSSLQSEENSYIFLNLCFFAIFLLFSRSTYLIRRKYQYHFAEEKFQPNFIEGTAAVSLINDPLSDISAQSQKRVFDVIISSFILVFILSWLIPILAVLIKLDSRGPVFFTQLRSGKNNIPFRIIKLRSLKGNIDADKCQVTRNDSRITRFGSFLRKTNLDELPQFFNVLAGNMSIIGSRPHMLKHTEEYSLLCDNYMLRHSTKPGITGWAQVNGYRGEIKEPGQLQKRIEHDLWYMKNWRISLDFKIFYLTVVKTLYGDENAF